MLRVTYQNVSFNGKEYQLDFTTSAYLRLHLRDNVKYTNLTVSQEIEHRPDLVATKAYGTPDAWWVICLVNGIINPQRELITGRHLKIPALNDIEQVLQQDKFSSKNVSRVGNKIQV